MNLQGKAAVVSGGASGIGRATVLALARRGAKVVVADIDERGGRETVRTAMDRGGSAMFTRCDVTKSEDLTSAFASARENYGRFDIAFNNAGIGGEDLFADDPGNWKRLIDIDLTAVIDATRIAVREMKRSGGGVIVNTASLIGLGPMSAAPVYAAAKAGVVNFSRSLGYLAIDANIRVNTICPELVDTPMAAGGLGEKVMKDLRATGEILRAEDIAIGVVELIEDDGWAGAVMRLTIKGGKDFPFK
jgi:15-hydroxyprostaglandin dehydrogenase (NAD)